MNSTALLTATHIGGPTLLLEIAGLKILTDPTFDQPGEYRHPETNSVLVKLTPPALGLDAVEPVDLVLLSHDQHVDNLDHSGRDLLTRVPGVITTVDGAARLGGGSTGLRAWEETSVALPAGGQLDIIAVPALHGPEGAETTLGPVIGFVLRGPGLPLVYVSGDNASLTRVEQIADRFGPVDVAVLFAGKVSTHLLDGADLTLSSAAAATAAGMLDASAVIGVHTEGWTHFTEGPEELRAAFVEAGLDDRLVTLVPGTAKVVSPRAAAARP